MRTPPQPKPEMKDDATNTPELATSTPELPTKPSEPYFIVPPGFRANTFFVGMEREYRELDRRLFDNRRRDGTATVLLHGQPGGGKSHLAREYIYNNRKKFKGGIFWITAKLREEIYQAYWTIYQKIVIKESPELAITTDTKFYDEVKAWFASNSDWLMVFDGLKVEPDEDPLVFQRLIPDSKNASIIYISLSKRLETMERLLRPFPIRVGELKEGDARKLLFKELHMHEPNDAEVRSATELVRKIGGLPLAIDAISHRIADTHEPLVKYSMKSYSADPKLHGTYSVILEELRSLGHDPAWHLINILCFFGQNIPVELVHLGLRALKNAPIEVRSSLDDGKPDINLTFGVLMRYALIERNEPDDKDSQSMHSSRDSLVEPEPIDMIKVHGVVQNFCCDSLNGHRLLPQYLQYAVQLFALSYRQANLKIKQKPEPARVSDYRYYLIHCLRLLDHTVSYQTKTQSLQRPRERLQPILESIEEEIRLREPGSSQESVNRGIFQVSIFDRTSSSSSSGPSVEEAPTPDHRPSPLLLKPNENPYGLDIAKPFDSPRSLGTISPGSGPRIVGHSPDVFPPYIHDPAYDGDREGPRSYPMETNLSGATARPPDDNSKINWTDVPTEQKPKKLRGPRELGPSPARAELDRRSVGRSQSPGGRRASQDAFTTLSELHRKSPPPLKNQADTFWKRTANRFSLPTASKPGSWAAVAAGQKPAATSPVPGAGIRPTPSPPTSPALFMQRGRSDGSAQGQNVGRPSPLASEFKPHDPLKFTSPTHNDFPSLSSFHPSRGKQAIPGQPSSRAVSYAPQLISPLQLGQPVEINNPNFYNPGPLPYEGNISITTKRPFPQDLHNEQTQTYAASQSRPHSPPPPQQFRAPYYDPQPQHHGSPIYPVGYYSQPLSRAGGSNQSNHSMADTEPLRFPPNFSPYLDDTFSESPRHRLPDGRPLRKSPRGNYALPQSNEVSPADSSQAIASVGGWIRPSSPAPMEISMSRSSSGPGMAFETADQGLGIMGFDGQVQFGEHEPVSLQDARRRTVELEQRHREQNRQNELLRQRMQGLDSATARPRAGSTPYPNVNLIPTESDPVDLHSMLQRQHQVHDPLGDYYRSFYLEMQNLSAYLSNALLRSGPSPNLSRTAKSLADLGERLRRWMSDIQLSRGTLIETDAFHSSPLHVTIANAAVNLRDQLNIIRGGINSIFASPPQHSDDGEIAAYQASAAMVGALDHIAGILNTLADVAPSFQVFEALHGHPRDIQRLDMQQQSSGATQDLQDLGINNNYS